MLSKALKEQIIKYRKDLHQIPELGFEEFKTQKYLKKTLLNLGFIVEEVAKTGLIGIKKGKTNTAIAFRSDIDGLPVVEKTNLPFSSIHEGKMHACGHDGHMSILLGFANYISKLELQKTIVLIFQPAEEGPGGAKEIIESGILKKYEIKKIFGLHLYPEIPQGKIGLTKGALMAQVGEFDIEINGVSAHGAMPQKGIDSIYIASQLIQAVQSIVSRNINPMESAIVTIGKITGGEARNVLAEKVILNGTMRAFSSDVYDMIKKRLSEIVWGLEKMFTVKIKFIFRDMYPALINNEDLYYLMKDILTIDEIVELEPIMIAEDFSFYLQEIPGYFCMLGTKTEKYYHPLHSSYFNFNDEVMFRGVELYIQICQKLQVL